MKQHTVETLEARIAPAILFLSGLNLDVKNSSGFVEPGNTAAATAVDATKALPLNPGDSVVLDLDGDHLLDVGEPTLVKLSTGRAIVFFSDFNGSGRWDKNEISGLALGNGANVTVDSAIRGSVATTLTSLNVFTPDTIQKASIDGLKITGYVEGSVLAGTGLKNVRIQPANDSDSQNYSVGGVLATGTATNARNLSYGNVQFTAATFTPTAGFSGGDISNVSLARGASGVHAGDGGSHSSGNAGPGGNISGLVVSGGIGAQDVIAGAGGDVTDGNGNGGAGGYVDKVKIVRGPNKPPAGIHVISGTGGDASGGIGGEGGKLTNISVTSRGVVDGVDLAAGAPGQSNPTGNFAGAKAGSLFNVRLDLGRLTKGVTIHTADGGDSGQAGAAPGGNAGSIDKLTFRSLGMFLGGGSTAPQEGVASPIDIKIFAGMGGDGGDVGGIGAAGGSIANLKVSVGGFINGEFSVRAGNGGVAGSSAAGGNGGELSTVSAQISGAGQGAEVVAGHGGEGHNANGGLGGSLTKVSFQSSGYLGDDVDFVAGNGGAKVGGSNGGGGNGGIIIDSRFLNRGGAIAFNAHGGEGGATGSGNGGIGGGISKLKAQNYAEIVETHIVGGAGGASDGAAGVGGKGGDLSELSVRGTVGGADFFFNSGSGGSANGNNAFGGVGGKISKVALTAPLDSAYFNKPAGHGGNVLGGTGAVGGEGGSVEDISGRLGVLELFAQTGGNVVSGTAGHGGNVKNITVSVTRFARVIAGGDGGDAGSGTAGIGGDVSNVTVKGDIGDFEHNFNGDGGDLAMGGLVAGRGGALGGVHSVARNGSLTAVSAGRIAAIFAGTPSTGSLDSSYAVFALSNISALEIGADVNLDNTFAFTNGTVAGYQLTNGAPADNDVALDGLVLVRNAGYFLLPVTPLMLVKV